MEQQGLFSLSSRCWALAMHKECKLTFGIVPKQQNHGAMHKGHETSKFLHIVLNLENEDNLEVDVAYFTTLGSDEELNALTSTNRLRELRKRFIQGAGGMHMVDPLFQRILVKECQSRKIPVIFDEVFTGFWRLGRESAAELLGCWPDVACFAKLMTGGVVPLAATLTTESIFEAFKGDSKLMALLHGHSYSAHAVGCASAAKAIQWFKDPSTNPNIDSERKILKQLWDMELVQTISAHPAVERVVVLGTLFALQLKSDGSDAGYASLFASSLVQQLRADGLYIRPLGNVIYLMCGPCTSPHFCTEQLHKVHRSICEFSKRQSD
ncbi:bifunctional dethiobiotin synthetase/7,8-diamino-pelargonic acid aminotransferase, mitochondrial-like [Curcuma longa]|uniref:bifunctional dethiobiotin synthetase/7,8-diamino-pelargonic acid aminotransferase, mitochondrial-like n=1 Tax=Curcuma longa TaxID=136217 RepID=UPI003D9F4128